MNMRRVRRRGGNKEKVFGCDLLEHLTASSQEIPQVLRSCSEFLEKNGIVDGIYRLSGVSSNIQKLRSEFEGDGSPDLSRDVYLQDIHCVSSLCKAYFRELPNPLLTYQLYDKFAEAVAIQLEEERLVKIRDVLKELPAPHYRTLEFLMRHLVRVASYSSETNMHSRNLAIVWAPNLLRSKDIEVSGFNGTAAFMEVRVQSIVVEFILTHVPQLFPEQGVLNERRKSLPSPSAMSNQDEGFFRSIPTQSVPSFGNISPGDGPLPIRPYHAIIEGTDKRKGSLKGRKWMSIFNIGGRFHDQRRRNKHSTKEKDRPALRPARSMDSLSISTCPNQGSRHPVQRPPSTNMSPIVTPSPQSGSDLPVSAAAIGGSEYAVTYRRGTGLVSGGAGTHGTYTALDPDGSGTAGSEGLQSRSPGLSTKVGRRAAMHITGPTMVTVPLHITSNLALGVLQGGGANRVIHRNRDKDGGDRVEDRGDRVEGRDGGDRAEDRGDRVEGRDGGDRAEDRGDRVEGRDGGDRVEGRDGGDRAEEGGDKVEGRDGGDRAEEGGDKVEGRDGGDRAEEGGDRAEEGGDRVEDGGEKGNRGMERKEEEGRKVEEEEKMEAAGGAGEEEDGGEGEVRGGCRWKSEPVGGGGGVSREEDHNEDAADTDDASEYMDMKGVEPADLQPALTQCGDDGVSDTADVLNSTELEGTDMELSGYVQDNFDFLDHLDHLDCSAPYQVNEFSVEPPGHSDDEYEIMEQAPPPHHSAQVQTHLQSETRRESPSEFDAHRRHTKSLSLPYMTSPVHGPGGSGSEEEVAGDDSDDDDYSSEEDENMFYKSLPSDFFLESLSGFKADSQDKEDRGHSAAEDREDGEDREDRGRPAAEDREDGEDREDRGRPAAEDRDGEDGEDEQDREDGEDREEREDKQEREEREDGEEREERQERDDREDRGRPAAEDRDGEDGEDEQDGEEREDKEEREEREDGEEREERQERDDGEDRGRPAAEDGEDEEDGEGREDGEEREEREDREDREDREERKDRGRPTAAEEPLSVTSPSVSCAASSLLSRYDEDEDMKTRMKVEEEEEEAETPPTGSHHDEEPVDVAVDRDFSVTSTQRSCLMEDTEDTCPQFVVDVESREKMWREPSETYRTQSRETDQDVLRTDIWDELEDVICEVIEDEEDEPSERTSAADDEEEEEQTVSGETRMEDEGQTNETDVRTLEDTEGQNTDSEAQRDEEDEETFSSTRHEFKKTTTETEESRTPPMDDPQPELVQSDPLDTRTSETAGVGRTLVVSKQPKVYQVKAVPVVPPKPQHCKLTAMSLRQQRDRDRDRDGDRDGDREMLKVLTEADRVFAGQQKDEDDEDRRTLRERRRDEGAPSRNSPLSMCFDEAVAIATMRREKERAREGELEGSGK